MAAPPLRALVAPSLLAGDFAALGGDCERMMALKAHWLHVDIMDGHFVPNLTIGAGVVKALRRHMDGTAYKDSAYLDCHLMVENPGVYVKPLGDAGASRFTFHIEAVSALSEAEVKELIAKIKAAGMEASIAVKPGTPVETVLPYVEDISMVLVMTVEPGFGGQSFMADTMPKVALLRQRYPLLNVQVDGGVNATTVQVAAEAGANVIVAGSAVFKSDDPAATIGLLARAVESNIHKE